MSTSEQLGSREPGVEAGRHPVRRRPPLLTELAWVCLVMGVPLGAGLAAAAALGWWPGLAAFLVAAVPTGVVGYRTDPRRHRG